MNLLVAACGVLLIGWVETAQPSAEDLKAYQDAKAAAKRDPAAHVRLALWCEAHGLEAERLKHLAIAVLADPRNATARGLMGLVSYHGQWQSPAEIADKLKRNEQLAATLAEYNAKREKTANTADAQWHLALWCEEKGLKAEATAHLTAVTRLEPGREAAWKHLGCKKHNGRWMNEAQIAAEHAEVEAQKKADHHYKPLLEKWSEWLGQRDKRAEAERLLAELTDPRAVPAVLAVFGAGRSEQQVRAVQVLGQIDSPVASRALASLAMFSKKPEVRRQARETLRQRDAREFADLIISLLRGKIDFEVRPVGGPGSPGELFVKGKKANVKRVYDPPGAKGLQYLQLQRGDTVMFDQEGLPVIVRSHLYETYVGPAPVYPNYTRMMPAPQAQLGPGASAALANVPGLAPALQKATHGSHRAPALPTNSMFASSPLLGSWQSFPTGFGSWNTFMPMGGYNAAMPYMAVLPESTLGTRPTTLSNGPGGVENEYFVFSQNTIIPIGQMMKGGVDTAKQQLQTDVDALENYNKAVEKSNQEVASALEDVTGTDLGTDREAWKKWWVDQVGYAYFPQKYDDNPTIVQNVPIAALSPGVFTTQTPVGLFQRISCFGAGTLVHTISGNVPIEKLAVGDQLLTQDTKTGALSYQPILVVHHNPPSKTFRIRLNDESVISSEFHRFWKAGRGWVMARDLKVGDTIRTLDGLAKVTEFETDKVQPVYNLDVAQTGSFFVGEQGALVHDNTLPAPVHQPFDAEPELAAAQAKAGNTDN